MTNEDSSPFFLGMFTVSGSPAFPALILGDDAAISIDSIAPLAARIGLALTGKESISGLLQNWDHNFRALKATVAALADPVAGKYFRSALTATEFLVPCAPVDTPRQIFSELTGLGESGLPRFISRPASTLVGPKAKVHLPNRAGKVVGEVKVGIVIGGPAYQSEMEEARDAIAGYLTVTDITLVSEDMDTGFTAKSHPSFLPTGPYFVPAAFAGAPDSMEMNLIVNGESSLPSNTAQRRESLVGSVARLSKDVQLFPGDLICCGVESGPVLTKRTAFGDGDIIETAIHGLGQQTLNAMRPSYQ